MATRTKVKLTKEERKLVDRRNYLMAKQDRVMRMWREGDMSTEKMRKYIDGYQRIAAEENIPLPRPGEKISPLFRARKPAAAGKTTPKQSKRDAQIKREQGRIRRVEGSRKLKESRTQGQKARTQKQVTVTRKSGSGLAGQLTTRIPFPASKRR